jgi:hypothetical protein
MACWALAASVPGLAQNAAAAIPYREDGAGLGQQAMTTGGIALLLLALAVAVLLAVRRKLGRQLVHANLGGLRCAASARLSAQTRVHVVLYRGREYLLAQSGDNLLRIAEFEAADPATEQTP